MTINRLSLMRWMALVAIVSGFSGCSSLRFNLMGFKAIPASRVPAIFLEQHPKANLQTISLSRLRQDPPEVYLLDEGDVLGIYIENILGNPDELPPVHHREDSGQPPAVGFPVPIREDGTIALPQVPPIPVAGLSLNEATDVIRNAYTIENEILKPDQDRVMVTLINKRQYRVLVVREEGNTGNSPLAGSGKRGTGHIVDLKAYENDLLHALNETGGFPGLDAKNEILIVRGNFADGVKRDQFVASLSMSGTPCIGKIPIPPDANVIRVPLRYDPDCPPRFNEQDIILRTGDIVMIQARDDEYYYTSGVLQGGEHLLPRDRDLDILQAISLANGQIGSAASGLMPGGGNRGGFGGGAGAAAGVPPSEVILLRRIPGGNQIAIRFDMNELLESPAQRVIIQPNDVIIVRYTCDEEIANALLQMVNFNFLFNGFRGSGF